MGIGTSHGAFYEDEFHYESSMWDKKYDPNDDSMVVTPPQMRQNQQLEQQDDSVLGGTDIAMKSQMPFPNNNNSDTDFKNRFPDLPPSGILNDLKKPDGSTVPLARKISERVDAPQEGTPEYDDWNKTWGAIYGMENGKVKGLSPEDFMNKNYPGPDYQHYITPSEDKQRELLFMRKKVNPTGGDNVPMS